MAKLPDIPVDLWRSFQQTIFGEKADDIQNAESFRWGVDDALGQLPPDDGVDHEAEVRRLEEEQQRRQEEQRRQIEEQARRDQEDYQRIEEERAVAARANELAASAPPGTSTYNDPTVGGTINQPLPPQSSAPTSFADTANSLITGAFGPESPAPQQGTTNPERVPSDPGEPAPSPLGNNSISYDQQTNTYGPASPAPAEPLSAPEPPKPLSFADQANSLITGAFGPESPIGQAAAGAYSTAVRGGMPDVVDIARKGDEGARYAIDTYGEGKGQRDDARIRELVAEANGDDTSNRGFLGADVNPDWAAQNPDKAAELERLQNERMLTFGGMAGAGGGGGIARDAIDAIKALRAAGMGEAALNAERELAMKSPMTLEQIQQQTGAALKAVAGAALPKPPLAAEVPNPSPLTAEERALNAAADARAREAPPHSGYLEDPTFGADEPSAPQPGDRIRLPDGTRARVEEATDLAPTAGPQPGDRVRLPDGTRARVEEAPTDLAPTTYEPPGGGALAPTAGGGGGRLPPSPPPAPPGGGGRQGPPGGWPGPGGGGLPPQVPPPPGATPAQVAAAAGASAKRGRRLNQGVNAPDSEVPARVRLTTQTTDPLAAVRWVEDMLTEPLHGKKLSQYDPQRASTHALINASGIANNRIVDELEPAVLEAARKGLQHELPAYLEDLHQRDILREFYRRGYEEQLAKTPNNQVQAQRAGMAKMRTREGANREMAYTTVDARLQAQEQALRKDGTWNDLQKAAQSIWDANAETLRRAERAGEVSPQDAAYYQWAYPHYVPTVPVSHLDPKGGGQVIGVAGSNLVTRGGTPYIRALDDVGTAGERLNPIAATRNAMIRGERAAARNKIAEQFVRIFDDAVQGGVIKPPTAGQTRRLWEGTEPIVWFDKGTPQRIDVPKIVADGIASSSNIQADEFANLYKRAVRGMVQNITGRRGGFFVTNFVRDARDYGFRRMAEEGPHHAIGIAGTWMDEAGKALADIARSNANVRGVTGAAAGAASGLATTDAQDDIGTRLRRAGEGAVLGAIFLGANPTRPTGKALQYVERGGGMGGASATWKAGQDWYKALLADGGIIRNPNDLARFMGQWGKEIATFHGLQGVNERTELIARTAASRRAERAGTPALGSMIAGRNASIDFDRYGTWVRAINGYIPFVGARTQGAAQFYRTLHDHPMMTTATVLATVAPVVAATEAYNRATPERAKAYDDVPTYLKDSGIVVMMPWAGSDARGTRPNYLWVPSQIDAPFIMALRAGMERLPGMESSANPRGVGEIAGALASSMMPVNAESPLALAGTVMPPVVRQVAELGSNTDFYRGTAIASDFNDQRASAFGRAVSGGINEVGRRTGVAPLQNVRPSHIDYAARQLPAYGDIASGASDLVAPNSYKRAEDRPIQNEPFVGGLAGRFIRDTGGENLRRAQSAAATSRVVSAAQAAGIRPGDLTLNMTTVIDDVPLTRDEQVRAQQAFNRYIDAEVARMQAHQLWRTPSRREEMLRDAIGAARERAQAEVMRAIPAASRAQRARAAASLTAGR